MKKIILLWLLLSCNSKQVKEVVSYYENGNPQIIEYTKIAWGDTLLIKKQELYNNGFIKFQTEFNKNFSKCSSYLETDVYTLFFSIYTRRINLQNGGIRGSYQPTASVTP